MGRDCKSFHQTILEGHGKQIKREDRGRAAEQKSRESWCGDANVIEPSQGQPSQNLRKDCAIILANEPENQH